MISEHASKTTWADWVRAGNHDITCVVIGCEDKVVDVFLGWWENGKDTIPMLETPVCEKHFTWLIEKKNRSDSD